MRVTLPHRGTLRIVAGASALAAPVRIAAPVLGLSGGADNRVNATIPRAEEATASPGKPPRSVRPPTEAPTTRREIDTLP